MVTMYYIVVTVFEYRYNYIEYDILCSWYNMDNGVNGSKWCLLWWVNGVYQKMRYV